PPWDSLVGEAVDWARTCAARRPPEAPPAAEPAQASGEQAAGRGLVFEESPPAPAAASGPVEGSAAGEGGGAEASAGGDVPTVRDEEEAPIVLTNTQAPVDGGDID
ncbi:MAG: hypothetical protein GY772_15305, partial [bacterium]|nr:hypothetical protein [bacterium]